MPIEYAIVVAIAVAIAAVFFWMMIFAKVTVFEYQKALLYKRGVFSKILDAGEYSYLKFNTAIQIVDTRKAMIEVPGQEILTKDNVSVKITLSGVYQVSDPQMAFHRSVNHVTELYSALQMILRELVGALTIDELLAQKGEIDTQLLARATEAAQSLGLTLDRLAVRDIMLPANLKKAFSGILEAQKEAQRQLEKARGEQAVLRNLANSSGMYEANPMLFQARLVQAMSTGNNSIVFNTDDKPLAKTVIK